MTTLRALLQTRYGTMVVESGKTQISFEHFITQFRVDQYQALQRANDIQAELLEALDSTQLDSDVPKNSPIHSLVVGYTGGFQFSPLSFAAAKSQPLSLRPLVIALDSSVDPEVKLVMKPVTKPSVSSKAQGPQAGPSPIGSGRSARPGLDPKYSSLPLEVPPGSSGSPAVQVGPSGLFAGSPVAPRLKNWILQLFRMLSCFRSGPKKSR